LKKLFLLLTILLISACSDVVPYTDGSEILAVYFHEHNRYSVTVKTGNELKMVRMPPNIPVKIFDDVFDSDPMWYRCDATYDQMGGATTGTCEIHVRSVDAINGAGWSHGKFGSGRTNRIY